MYNPNGPNCRSTTFQIEPSEPNNRGKVKIEERGGGGKEEGGEEGMEKKDERSEEGRVGNEYRQKVSLGWCAFDKKKKRKTKKRKKKKKTTKKKEKRQTNRYKNR